MERFNGLTEEAAQNELLKCCGSKIWAARVAGERPFASAAELFKRAATIWWSLGREDWLEAFRSHPRIGERKAEHQTSTQSRTWSAQEQAGMRAATAETARDLASLNRQYQEKFGFIYIVCATGKTSAQLLAELRQRLGNDPEEELRIAAAEQAAITELRLRKLLNQ